MQDRWRRVAEIWLDELHKQKIEQPVTIEPHGRIRIVLRCGRMKFGERRTVRINAYVPCKGFCVADAFGGICRQYLGGQFRHQIDARGQIVASAIPFDDGKLRVMQRSPLSSTKRARNLEDSFVLASGQHPLHVKFRRRL